jgi:hypothetical protein
MTETLTARSAEYTVPVDTDGDQVHTQGVGALPNRLNIPDARGHGAYLRVTKHPDQRKVVLSHWRGTLCVASTPVDLGEVPAIIGVLADALGDAVAAPDPVSAAVPPVRSPWSRLRDRLRPAMAKVVELPVRRVKQHD